ncbi:protein kinase domain-containing protein, partial [Singulisphaera rosea]
MKKCPSDEQLKQLVDDELGGAESAVAEAHVEACPDCRDRLDLLARLAEPSQWRKRVVQAYQDEVVSLPRATAAGFIGRLGSYDIKDELGQGGMGRVYRAYDSRIRQWRAIKVVNRDMAASPKYRAQFMREARAAAAITSDFIVIVHHVEDDAPGFPWPFLVMELIEGQSLDKWLARAHESEASAGHLTARQTATIAYQIARGLAAAHNQGLVHRDVKPSNILLDRKTKRAKIADFGLARLIEGDEVRLTETSEAPGSPSYMSPEQFDAPGSVDGQSDVFSLGVVLYEMLTGRLPFPGKTRTVVSDQVRNSFPAAPQALCRSVPRDLGILCMGCLEKDRADRIGSAAKLAEDLRRFLNHEPIRYRPPGPIRRAQLFARRNPTLVMLTSVFFIVAVFGTAQFRTALLNAQEQTKNEQKTHELTKGERAKAEALARAKSKLAEDKAKEAREKAAEAAASDRRKRHEIYISDMQRAWLTQAENRPDEVRTLLMKHIPQDQTGVPDLRGFEWFYLDRLLSTGVRSLSFGDVARAVRFSPDGTRLA